LNAGAKPAAVRQAVLLAAEFFRGAAMLLKRAAAMLTIGARNLARHLDFRRLRGFSLGLFMLFCAACASGAPAEPEFHPTLDQASSLQAYQLGAGDHLRISVYGEPDLTGEFVVSPVGTVAYPLVGEFPAQGKTVAEFTETLREALQVYVRQPNISVEVLNYRPFYILGEVKNPNTYPFSSGLTVLNAVATAGGFTPRADSRRVFIKHANEVTETEYRLTTATPVQPGDTVRIPERRF
jgi:polysaccharide biosynthesis/export protein